MWSVVDGDETEREQILQYVRRFGGEKKRKVALTRCIENNRRFLR